MTHALLDRAQTGPVLIEAAGARIAVRRHGDGPPVLCLHATGHGGRDFDAIARRLGASYDFIAPDFPGQAESPREAAPASARRYCEIAGAVADALQLSRFVVLGNSIGGAAAIRYAAAHPERARGLVLCNPGGLGRINTIVRLYCWNRARQFARGERGDRRFGAWFARYYQTILQTQESAARRAEIVADGYRSAAVLREAWKSFAKPDADIRSLTPKLTMPVLYAWAMRDRAVAWAFSRDAALRAPNARLERFDAGHSAFLERPEAFDAAFVRFVSGLPA